MISVFARPALPVLVALAAIVAAPLAQAADREVTIVNKTGVTMVEFYGSNVKTRDWEEDILGRDVLQSGKSVEIDFDDGTGACRFDFKAVFEDGDVVIEEDVDVCRVGRFTFE